jgi:hypothetical protein
MRKEAKKEKEKVEAAYRRDYWIRYGSAAFKCIYRKKIDYPLLFLIRI